jgi:hypothetical protein
MNDGYRDVFISIEQRTPGNLNPDEWAILRRVIEGECEGRRAGSGEGARWLLRRARSLMPRRFKLLRD